MFLAEAAVLADRRHPCQQIVEQLTQVATLTPTPVLHVQLAYAIAVLAADTDAEALYRQALSADLGRWPWVRARLELAFGKWLRRQGRGQAAVPFLVAARATLDRIGAIHWAAQAQDELAAHAAAAGAR